MGGRCINFLAVSTPEKPQRSCGCCSAIRQIKKVYQVGQVRELCRGCLPGTAVAVVCLALPLSLSV